MLQGVEEVVLACYLNHCHFLYGSGWLFAQQRDEVQVLVLKPQYWQIERPLLAAVEQFVVPWQQGAAEMT